MFFLILLTKKAYVHSMKKKTYLFTWMYIYKCECIHARLHIFYMLSKKQSETIYSKFSMVGFPELRGVLEDKA